MKMKELSEKNRLLQLRILELNEIVRDLSNCHTGDQEEPKKIIKLRQENEHLKRQISDNHLMNMNHSNIKKVEDHEDGGFDQNSFL